jgi:hypothetical protein
MIDTMFEWWNRFTYSLGRESPPLEGIWERIGDDFAGCRIVIRDLDQGGLLVNLAPRMREVGWQVGDRKWQAFHRRTLRLWEFEDLYKEYDLRTQAVHASYHPSQIIFVGPDSLETRHPGRPRQKWLRVGRITIPVGSQDAAQNRPN